MSQNPGESGSPFGPPPIPGAASPFHPLPAVPPLMSEAPNQATWPMPLGIVSIVLGACASLQAVGGMALPLLSGVFRSMPMPRGQPNPFDAIEKYTLYLFPVYCFGVLVGALLVIAGIGMIKRRPWAAPAVIWWSILKIVYAIATCIVTAFMQMAQMKAVLAQTANAGASAPPAEMMSSISIGVAAFTAVFTLLWLGALPIFMLIWFRRASVKREVASWRSPPVL